ncbi:MAG: hypothetical protein ACTHKS_18065 [Gaiellaceae bacterium]
MRRTLVIAALLGVGVLVGTTGLGSTIAGAATPFTNVIIGNTSTNPVPVTEQNLDNGNIRVHEEGTANVAGTVALGSTDSNNLDSAATHLSRIDTAASKLAFDGSGSLKVSPQGTQTVHVDNSSLQVSGLAPMQTLFADEGITVTNDNATHTVDSHSQTLYADFVSLGGLEGTSAVFFVNGTTDTLVLDGPVGHGQDSYVLNLTRPVPYDSIQVFCSNPTPCKLGLSVSGTVGQP